MWSACIGWLVVSIAFNEFSVLAKYPSAHTAAATWVEVMRSLQVLYCPRH